MPRRTTHHGRRGRARAESLGRRFGAELRVARVANGLSQQQLADLVGISQSFVSLVERGRRWGDWPTACALCAAVGHDLSLRLFPARPVSVRDSGQLELIQRIVAVAHPSWHARIEQPVAASDLRAADLVLVGPKEVLHIEVERSLVDLQAQLRAALGKRAALSERFEVPVRLVLALPRTRRTRVVLATLQPTLGKALPLPSSAVWRSIRSGSELANDGLLLIGPQQQRP